MKRRPDFYALIIGSEILNGRREDRHFPFLRDELNRHGLHFAGSFLIEDRPDLIADTIAFIARDPHSVLLSFGGIGSTPDDHTREAAAKALRDGTLHLHPQFERIILERLGEQAYPHPINMARLPAGAELLPNPVNGMPGFALDGRFFFMPGFPEMSHPMVEYAIEHYFSDAGRPLYRHTLTALCRENEMIELMRQAPEGVEVSSLPKLYDDGWRTTLSVAGEDPRKSEAYFRRFVEMLERRGIPYGLGEE